jgi:hypothetical protein
MIRFTWLQFRLQAAVALAALAAFAVVLAATAPHMASLYAASGITGCHGGGCANAASAFLARLDTASPYQLVYVLGIALILTAPAVLGIFWGAPLIARELESGTSRLAWTQGITRTRWLASKLALTGLAAMAVTEALSLAYTWWADPIGKAISHGGSASMLSTGPYSLALFDAHGVVPLGYAAFAFTLGAALGALIRRALPAMAVTLAVFAAVQVAMPLGVRPHLLPPDHTVVSGPSFFMAASMSVGTLTATTVPGHPEAWILTSGPISAAGQPATAPAVCLAPSPDGKGPAGNLGACLSSRGIREAITYQPLSRYWPLQWLETGIFLALAVALAGCCFWRLGRRRS